MNEYFEGKITNESATESFKVMLAEKYDEKIHDPKGWLMSEKLDGVRCFWDGEKMETRNGNAFYPPKWFVDEFPDKLALDGELWSKRNDF